jgi:hypothetical protein
MGEVNHLCLLSKMMRMQQCIIGQALMKDFKTLMMIRLRSEVVHSKFILKIYDYIAAMVDQLFLFQTILRMAIVEKVKHLETINIYQKKNILHAKDSRYGALTLYENYFNYLIIFMF